jgi:hypothetical protein
MGSKLRKREQYSGLLLNAGSVAHLRELSEHIFENAQGRSFLIICLEKWPRNIFPTLLEPHSEVTEQHAQLSSIDTQMLLGLPF